MNILIIGAGAVGQYLGGKLSAFTPSAACKGAFAPSAAVNNISFIEKSKEKIDFINKNGITVKDGEKTYKSSGVKAYFSFSDIPLKNADFEYIFLCVKAYHLKSALEEIMTFAGRAKIVVFQNGLGNEERVCGLFDPSNVISATTTTAVYIDGENNVRASGKGGLAIAPADESLGEAAPIVAFLRDAFQKSGFNVKSYSNYKSLKWSKLLINMIGNASIAVVDMSSLEAFGNDALVRLEIEAFREAVRTAKKQNIKIVNLPGFPVAIFARALFFVPFFILKPFLKKKIGVSRGDKKPSLQIELLNKNKNTENEYINGAIFEESVKLGIPAPANKAIYDALEDIVNNNNWEYYRGKPEILWRLYEKYSRGLKV